MDHLTARPASRVDAAGDTCSGEPVGEPAVSAAAPDPSAALSGGAPSGGVTPASGDSGDAPSDGGRRRRPIRIAIVDDDLMVRSGLRLLFGGSSEFEVVAEAADGDEAVTMAAAHWPDVILMDIRMPRVDGLIATQRIRSGPNPPQIIVLTTFNIDEYVLESLRGGASGFLLKDTPPQEIIAAVRMVADGAGMLSPAVVRGLIDYVADPAAGSRRSHAKAQVKALTDRERDVALGLARGWSNAEIGSELGMGIPTVKGHVSRLLAKLGLNNRVQVALLVHDAELL